MTGASQREGGFLLVSVSTAGAPATLRTHVWRKLRGLGALYLQQSVCLLPDLPAVRRVLLGLIDRVERDGGSARLIPIAVLDAEQVAALRAEMSAARDLEYQEVLERAPSFLAELAYERGRGNVTFEEVEESEADLDRFRSWLARIAARDYFNAPLRAAAHAAVQHCADELAAFEADALARDLSGPAAAPAATTAHLTEPTRASRHLTVASDPSDVKDGS